MLFGKQPETRRETVEKSTLALPTLTGLSQFVRDTLCDRDRLDPFQTPFFRSPVKRGGKTTAMMYHVEGPRLLKSSALWVVEEHRLLFYDSTGTRFLEVHLSESPNPS
jgi:hypothetical protein